MPNKQRRFVLSLMRQSSPSLTSASPFLPLPLPLPLPPLPKSAALLPLLSNLATTNHNYLPATSILLLNDPPSPSAWALAPCLPWPATTASISLSPLPPSARSPFRPCLRPQPRTRPTPPCTSSLPSPQARPTSSPATSRLETILRANRVPFKAVDIATDEKARMLWGRRAGKDESGRLRKLPGLVQEGPDPRRTLAFSLPFPGITDYSLSCRQRRSGLRFRA